MVSFILIYVPDIANMTRYVGWTANHDAFANGDNNLWALDNTPFSWSYYKRQDLPTHFGLAEGWTMADMYAQSVVASTNPNRGWCDGLVSTNYTLLKTTFA
jgi:phospholipase C